MVIKTKNQQVLFKYMVDLFSSDFILEKEKPTKKSNKFCASFEIIKNKADPSDLEKSIRLEMISYFSCYYRVVAVDGITMSLVWINKQNRGSLRLITRISEIIDFTFIKTHPDDFPHDPFLYDLFDQLRSKQ